MNTNALLLLLILVTGTLLGQKTGEVHHLPNPFVERTCVSSFERVPLGTTSNLEAALIQYLKANNPNFSNFETTAKLDYYRGTEVSEHYSFRQYYRGVEVYNSEVKFNLDKNGTILSVFDNSYNTSGWLASLQADANQLDAMPLAHSLAEKAGYPEAEVKEQVAFAVIDGVVAAVKSFEIYDEASGAHRAYLTDKDLNILMEADLNRYGGNRALATAKVFRPDPLTTAGISVYAIPYADKSSTGVEDFGSSELNQQRQTVTIELLEDTGGVYLLENDWVRIAEFSAPAIDTFKFTTTTLDFGREEAAFEAVNAYYHITRFNQYIRDTLGLDSLANFSVEVDPHALNGQENSMFSAGGNNPRLFFGEGGVDDAEDADVIVHEYGHALSNQATPNGNSGSQRRALDEGFGDYVAATYSRTWSDFRWDDIFTWDGHNEYWPGRSATNPRVYIADSLGGGEHAVGEMWSSALMQVWEVIGRETTDKIALQALYSFASGITFPDAAQIFLVADSLLYQGGNASAIQPIFVARRFIGGPVGLDEAALAASKVTVGNTEGFAYNQQPIIITSISPIQQLELYNITGTLVIQQAVNQETVAYFDAPNLPVGVYVLRVTTANGASSTHKVSKVQ